MPSIDSIVDRFFIFNTNQDGKLTFEEFKAASAEELERRKERAERRGDTFDAAAAEAGLKERFERFNVSQSGYLTREELKAGLEALRQEMSQRRGQGQNNDGRQRGTRNQNQN